MKVLYDSGVITIDKSTGSGANFRRYIDGVGNPLKYLDPRDTEASNYKFVIYDANNVRHEYDINYTNDGMTAFRFRYNIGNTYKIQYEFMKNENKYSVALRNPPLDECGYENIRIVIEYYGDSELLESNANIVCRFSEKNIYLVNMDGSCKAIKSEAVEQPKLIIVRFGESYTYKVDENGTVTKI